MDPWHICRFTLQKVKPGSVALTLALSPYTRNGNFTSNVMVDRFSQYTFTKHFHGTSESEILVTHAPVLLLEEIATVILIIISEMW